MQRQTAIILLSLVSALGGGTTRAEVRAVSGPDPARSSRHYPGNRPPLRPSPFVKLPVGATQPAGWLKQQLRLQSEGFHGHLTEISAFLKKEGNSWLSPDGQGQHGWEEVPYWLKGFGDCAYLVNDPGQVREARLWIEAILKSQRPDGYFGPHGKGGAATVESTKGKYDLWPNMVVLDCLRSYHEFTRDERVLPFMTRYFRWELDVPDADFLPPFWQQQRAADNLDSVYWLYNRTGERWLLDLAAKIHAHTANWTDGIASWHNVNMTQGFGGPTTFWPQSNDRKHLEASERNFQTFRSMYGDVPGGLFGGDENCRPGYTDPRQAVETCGMVEFMRSAERLLTITGNPVWADRCEDVAFNALPAALTADMKALRYLTAPNMATSDRRSHSPGIQNGGPMFCMDPHNHRCCQHNFGQGWPYLAEHLWLATADDGLALAFPLACKTTATVAQGEQATVEVDTHYPFDDRVSISVRIGKPVAFPLYLRIPGWCHSPRVQINGQAEPITGEPARGFLRIDRTWNDGDTVVLNLPMSVRVRTWERNHKSVSIDRGPLTYSLLIPSKTVRSGGTERWPAWEILPTGPWNLGLIVDANRPEFAVETRPWPANDQPWTPETAPVRLSGRGKVIPEWQLDRFGLVAPLQDSPVKSSEPEQAVTLIPMGAARIRIAACPVVATGSEGHAWQAPLKPAWAVASSHVFEADTTDALCDGVLPRNSDDHTIARFTWWPHKGTTEWVQYDFPRPRSITRSSVYWFDDTGRGGCAIPRSYRLLYRSTSGGDWIPVPDPKADLPARDRLNHLTFGAVEATAVRLEVNLQPDRSGGILEWQVD
ncbi:MAG: glycoside hydrolase family 127 protein [Isosphaeraceae bacterium]